MIIKELIKYILEGHKYSSNTYVKYLKRKGVKIGDNIEIFFPNKTHIDDLNPHLLEIGSFVSMTGPITILTHDYSVCVTKKKYNGYILGSQKKTVIGDNVFLGWGCCILPGANVGNNVIIGAKAVVSGKIESNSVYAGNPARKICTLDEFYSKRRDRQVSEAVKIYQEYKIKYNETPPKELFHEYFFLFCGGRECFDNLIPEFERKLYDHGNYEESKECLINNVSQFKSYSEFCKYAETGVNNG